MPEGEQGGEARGWPLRAFLCIGYLYSLHHILSGPSIFSRIFSNIENIFATRQVTEAQNPRSKVPKVASQTRSEPPKLKEFSRHRPETSTVRQDRFRRRSGRQEY